jgi:RNA-directed DNA polymerase
MPHTLGVNCIFSFLATGCPQRGPVRYAGRNRLGMKQLRRRFCDRGWRFAHNGVVFTGASSVAVTRYRYRGSTIPTPWTPKPAATTHG